MLKVKFKIKEAISKWNDNNPMLRKKTVGSVAKELGVSASSLSQLEDSNQFQKHMVVVLESDVKFEQMACFDLYKKLDIPIINKLEKITVLLECEICDLVEVGYDVTWLCRRCDDPKPNHSSTKTTLN